METLINQLSAVCDDRFYQSPLGQCIPLLLVALLGGTPVVEPQSHLSPSQATRSQVQVSLQQLLRGSKMPASFVVVGLIRAIEDVLDDCLQEALDDTPDWSLATQRLLGQGVLVDTGEVLTLACEGGTRAVERAQRVQVDLDRWRKLTAVILEHENLEQTIYEELVGGEQ